VWVADTGVGLRDDERAGIGLENARERLRSLFGAAARVELLPHAPRGVRAEMSFQLPATAEPA
jgi:LytS/YehU family sensor histidine kinase